MFMFFIFNYIIYGRFLLNKLNNIDIYLLVIIAEVILRLRMLKKITKGSRKKNIF